MNYPTREEFEQLKEDVRKLQEQQTEPIKITRLEIDSGSMHKRLDSVQEDIAVLKEDVGVLKIEMAGVRADILSIKATQSDHNTFFIEHGQRLQSIEEKQDTHTELLEQFINVGESHTQRFDQIETTQAEHSTMLREHSMMLREHSTMLREILTLLKQRPDE